MSGRHTIISYAGWLVCILLIGLLAGYLYRLETSVQCTRNLLKYLYTDTTNCGQYPTFSQHAKSVFS